MKKKLTVAIAVVMFILGACTSEEPLQQSTLERGVSHSGGKFRVSPEEAVALAMRYVDEISEPTTRSNSARRVKSIEAKGSPGMLTRSGEGADTLLYVINFEDEAGFAIMSADRRSQPVYALSDEGEFILNEDTNPGVQILMNGMYNDVLSSIRPPLNPGDSIGSGGVKVDPYDDVYRKVKVGPFLSAFQRSLGPTVEISKYCKNSKGELALTCREAIAIEQYISGQTYKNSFYNWDAINDGNDMETLSRMIRDIGDDMGLLYLTDKRHATYIDLRFIYPLMNQGFVMSQEELHDFFEDRAMMLNYLNNGWDDPIGMYGYSTSKNIEGLWVIDGYIGYLTPTYPSSIFRYLYHCVWGDGGACNGYYYVDDSKAFSGEPNAYHNSDVTDSASTFTPSYDINIMYFKPHHTSEAVGI